VADSDLIYVMQDGRLAEHGTHSQLLRVDGLYAEMWARQAHESDLAREAAE
jgi:ATP-binding cassette subfamily B protein